VADCQTYVKTIHHLHLHTPELILIPDTFLPSASSSKSRNNTPNTILINCLQEEFSGVPMHPVLRKYWSETAGEFDAGRETVNRCLLVGLDFITQLCVDDEDRPAVLVSVSNK
jgi:DNA mismatch repair protein MSH4